MVAFPAIVPTSRTYVPPRWPVTEARAQSGAVSTRLWGSLPGDGLLNLGYANITDASAALFIDAHRLARGPVIALVMPAEVFAGAAGALAAAISAANTGLTWHFPQDDPPRVDSVIPGRSSVTVNLIARLRVT
jgi:hypothetical protein